VGVRTTRRSHRLGYRDSQGTAPPGGRQRPVLILPNVTVPNLASHILGSVSRRLAADWQSVYGYQPVLLETFVETGRFTGASYRAANWLHVGQTKGRGKLDRYNEHALPVKDVYLYPLQRNYRRILTAPA